MMGEVLPIDGWKACGIDFNSKGCIVKYKHVDMSYLRCPCCGEPGQTIHRRYTVRVRDRLIEVLKANQLLKIPFIPRTEPLGFFCQGGVKYGLAAGDDITLDPEGEMG
ncbi:MAG: hypothetical protein ACI4OZ_06065 [Akkermansia sp.]